MIAPRTINSFFFDFFCGIGIGTAIGIPDCGTDAIIGATGTVDDIGPIGLPNGDVDATVGCGKG
jgi:hypothetical protein